MAAKNIKGITLDIGGDTTNLGKALEDSEQKSKGLQKELQQVNKLLKYDPGNTKLQAQQQDLLKQSVTETRQQLDILKDAEKQVQQQFKEGKVSEEQYRALTREVEATEGKLKNLEEQARKAIDPLAQIGQKAAVIGEKSEQLGNKLLPVTGGVVALGAASMASFNEIDTGYDTIITKTGATGDTLDGLQDSMDKVFASLPTDAETAGVAIGEVNTRFHATGEELEDMSRKFIEFAEINGTDLNSSIDNTDKIMKIFGVDASETGNVLGLLTAKGQETGISVDTMYSLIEKNGSTLKDMGLGLAESADLLARMEANGVDTSTALAGLRKAQQNATAEGKTLNDALGETIDRIKGAGSETEAAQIATELFGKKGAAEMAAAIREGRFDLEDLTASMDTYGKTVEDTYNATLDPADQAKVAMNNLKLAGADLAEAGQEAVAPMLQDLVSSVKDLTSWFRGLTAEQKQQVVRFLAVAASLGPVLIGFGKLSKGVGGVLDVVSKVKTALTGAGGLQGALAAIGGPVTAVIAIVAALAAAFVYLYKTNDEFREKVNKCVETVKTKVQELWTNLQPVFEQLRTALLALWEKIKPVLEAALGFIEAIFSGVMNAVGPLIDAVGSMITFVTDLITAFIALLSGDFDGFFEYLGQALDAAIEFAKSLIDAACAFITGFLDTDFGQRLKEIFSAIWDTIVSIFQGVGQWFSDRFTEAYEFITGVFQGIGGWFGERWADITNVFADVSGWFSQAFSDAWESIKRVFDDWVGFFSGLWDSISQTFSDLGTTLGDTIGGAVKSGLNGVIGWIEDTINDAIGIINGAIDMINYIPGVSVGYVDYLSLPRLAKGGILTAGRAMVAETGPELIEQVGGRTIVTPLTDTARNTPVGRDKGSQKTEVNVRIEHFHNERQQDIRELTKEVMEIAEELRGRDDKVYA